MAFVLIMLLLLYVLRKAGWFFSKNGLYGSHVATVSVFCLAWGAGIAVLVHELIRWKEPNWIVWLIFGYGIGAYVSIPNYGLVGEDTVPDVKRKRHLLISTVPLVAYVLTAILLALLW
jgi:hypothetical protein